MADAQAAARPGREPWFLARLALLVALLVAADLWLVRHTGMGLSDPRALGGLSGLVVLALGYARKAAEAAGAAGWQAWWGRVSRRALGWALAWPVLGAGCALAAFVMLTLSSLTIVPEPHGRPLALELEPMDGAGGARSARLEPGAGPRRLWLWTSPFGRRYALEATGYLPATLDVPPFTGATLRLDRDLQRSPTVLLRPPVGALRSLEDCDSEGRCGSFELCRPRDGGPCTEANRIARVAGHRGAFLAGWPQPIPRALLQDWRLELAALGLGDAETVMARTLVDWKNVETIEPASPLVPGERLRAEVRTRTGVLRALEVFVVPRSAFTDLPLSRVAPGAEG